jgi:hypothetical protein
MTAEVIPVAELQPVALFTPAPKAARRVLKFFIPQINNDHPHVKPVHAGRDPKSVVKKGETPLFTADEPREMLNGVAVVGTKGKGRRHGNAAPFSASWSTPSPAWAPRCSRRGERPLLPILQNLVRPGRFVMNEI